VELPSVVEHRNSADERAERCPGTLHIPALQRCGHLGDGRSIGFPPPGFACQLGLRLAAGTALQVRFPSAQFFEGLAQRAGARWASLDRLAISVAMA
jgi:hypothetical protein